MLEPVLQLARIGLVAGWLTVSVAAPITAGAPQGAETGRAGYVEMASAEPPSPRPKPAEATVPAVKKEAAAAPSGNVQAPAFSRETVIGMARTLAQAPYAEPESTAPESAAELNYDQYQRIEFKREAADWRSEPDSRYHIHYDSQGYLFDAPIFVNLVKDGRAERRPFRPADFRFFDLPVSPEDIGALQFAGFHLTTPLNNSGKFDDVINFRGASFFRVLAAGTVYGASARGLAVKTASQTREEFPAFREFWIEEPAADGSVTIHALLDSPSVAGAYTFKVAPGIETVVDVAAVLFPRVDLDNVGLAPISSMFDFAPHDPAPQRRDFRPRVHDSEGMLVHLRTGEWAWRPLMNPRNLEISVFAEQAPYGFGLLQRERDPAAYQDLETDYERRPSIWIKPGENWGAGKLTLIEIPTQNEFNDNIVLFWRPAAVWKAGQEVRIDYSMAWGLSSPVSPVANVEQSRSGRSIHNGRPMFVLDFDTSGLDQLSGIEPRVSAINGAIANVNLTANPITGGVRLTFEAEPQGAAPMELRALLARNERPVSETWLYRWSAE